MRKKHKTQEEIKNITLKELTDYELIKNSKYFNDQWYRLKYNLPPETDVVSHYLDSGWTEFKNPSPLFSTRLYFEQNPDVKDALINPLLHYEKFGRKECRRFAPPTQEFNPLSGKNELMESKAYYAPESNYQIRLTPEELLEKLNKYDVVSFDIFDTLILRRVAKPVDVFRLIGIQENIPDFCNLRIRAEEEARRKIKTDKVTIYDIYNMLQKYIPIPNIERAVEREMQIEIKLCIANPYMKKVFDKLCADGKNLILTSDMYLPQKEMKKILSSCGYNEGSYSKLFISCECNAGKYNGTLQKYVMKYIDDEQKIIHVGDNYSSDYEASKKVGWDALYYPSCADHARIFRDSDSMTMVESLYKGIVNTHLHSGVCIYNKDYEHGFLYGGLLVCGFCEWLNRKARNEDFDKLWFLARDMDIVHKVYNEFYNQVPNEYVSVSRCSILELTFEERTEEFIQFYFKTRALGATTTLGEALKETDMDFLIEELDEYSLHEDEIITLDNYEKVRGMLYKEKTSIVEQFSTSVNGGVKYFGHFINDSHKICAVDLGWSGTILVHLRTLFSRYFQGVDLYGALIGASNSSNVNDLINEGFLDTYWFSGLKNRDMRVKNETWEGNTVVMLLEAIFSSSQKTLLKYDLDEKGKCKLKFGHSTAVKEQIKNIEQGIYDFAKLYTALTRDLKKPLIISGVEAGTPFSTIEKDFEYQYLIFKNVREFADGFPRAVPGDDITTIGNIMMQRGVL